MRIILGISAYFHDSSACLIVEGSIVAAALEERFTRIKHDQAFPENAIQYCLKEAKINSEAIDEVVFFEKPFTKFERILDNFTKQAPLGFRPFKKAIQAWVKEKFWIEDTFRKRFDFKGDFSYCQHHLAHAANACYQSSFEKAAYLTIDGVGEKACTSYGVYEKGRLKPIAEQHFPHSIGLLYSAFTQYCGFKVNSGEYKLMGLAPYGVPQYKEVIYTNFVSISDQGVITLKLDKLGFLNDLKMVNKQFEQVFGVQSRKAKEPMTQFYKDVAASIQKVTEELVYKLVAYVQGKTGMENLVYSGGVALNCVLNSGIIKNNAFQTVFIQSASGDGGGAMGAALWSSYQYKSIAQKLNQEFLGPQFTSNEVIQSIDDGINYHVMKEEELVVQTAKYLHRGKVVGWFQGRMEFGPRALGNRSILASPNFPEMKSILNLKIKKREGFRPFAPVVLAEDFDAYFEDEGYDYSRMLYVAKGKQEAEKIPSCIHKDHTARVQKLTADFNPALYQLLTAFKKQSGIPVLINTSFNERGEPIVCSPKQAIDCFFNTAMDVLVMENILLLKSENKHIKPTNKSYELD